MLVAVLVFVVMLLLLVIAHEFGHFITAKWAGCKVHEFAFGFPPRLFSIKKGETRYSFNLIPLGGYVKIEGENMDDVNPAKDNFASKTPGWRIFILADGVIMNIILAVVLLSVQSVVGVPTVITGENVNNVRDLQTFIVGVDENSPAAVAGFQSLDRVISVGGVTDPTIEEIQSVVNANLGTAINVEVVRQGIRENLNVVPRENPPAEEGPLGVSLRSTGLEKVVWWKAPAAGLTRTWQMFSSMVTQLSIFFQQLVSGAGGGEALTGPVGIAIFTNEVTNLGPSYVLQFAALISLNLAIINILPIPALDGGRIVFVLLEVILRRRLPTRVEQWSHSFGFIALILLMLFVTFKDISKFL